MRYQNKADADYSIEENLRMEAEAHDEDYEFRMPFGLSSMTFTIDQVMAINDHAFKPGTYRRGWRKRRLFQLLDLENIRGKRVLEIGCGQGHNAVFFAMHGAQVCGFDLSEKGIDMARRIAEANGVDELCDFRVTNVSAMPYEDQFFDIVVCNAVLHHVVKYPKVTEEIHRVLKKGGKLCFAEGVRDNAFYRFVRSIKRAFKPVHYHGDIDLETSDLEKLTNGYPSVYFERFALVQKFAEGLGRDYNNTAAVRAVYWISFWIDRFLLAIFPPLRKQCLEVVGVAVK